jgi:hypothetical protein
MNNLKDISMKDEYATMLGYTQDELIANFEPYIDRSADKLGISRDELLSEVRDYYDGFSFDGENRLYNPFSTLNFFDDTKFKNYWFETGTPSYLVEYAKRHDLEVESFRGLEEDEDFTAAAEIEHASPSSFLFQSGYLSVREKNDSLLKLDYPNKEVLSSVAKLFLYGKFEIPNAGVAVIRMEKALARGEAVDLVKTYDTLLMSIPHDIYEREERKYDRERERNLLAALPLAESFFHAVLFAMLWASRLTTRAEAGTYWGDSDIEVEKNGYHYVVELKIADGPSSSASLLDAAMTQIREKGYADKYAHYDGAALVGIVVDRSARRVAAHRVERLAPESDI